MWWKLCPETLIIQEHHVSPLPQYHYWNILSTAHIYSFFFFFLFLLLYVQWQYVPRCAKTFFFSFFAFLVQSLTPNE